MARLAITLGACMLFSLPALAGLEDAVTSAAPIFAQALPDVPADVISRALTESAARTQDPGAALFSADEWKQKESELAGIVFQTGARFSLSNGAPFVVSVEPDSPADKAGLRAGDGLARVGATELTNVAPPELARRLRSPSPATLNLSLASGTNLAIALAPLPTPSVECSETLPGGIQYLRINGLYSDASNLLSAIGSADTARLILDFRGAAGNESVSASNLAALISARTSVLLLDGNTSGSAEALAAVLLAPGAGHVLGIGQTTAGDFMLRRGEPLATGDVLYFSAGRRLAVGGGLEFDTRHGLDPDVLLSNERDSEYEPPPRARDRRAQLDEEIEDRRLRERVRGDAVLRRAVDILNGLEALRGNTYHAPDSPSS